MNNDTLYKSFEKLAPSLVNSEQLRRSELGDKYNPVYSATDLLKGRKTGVFDISDPLFTSFTIGFDFLGSPLLRNTSDYIGCLSNDTDSDNALSGKIETTLSNVQSSILGDNIPTLNVIGSETYTYTTTEANISAADYIYLIDKHFDDADKSYSTAFNDIDVSNNKSSSDYQNEINEIRDKIKELEEKKQTHKSDIQKIKNKFLLTDNSPAIRSAQKDIDNIDSEISELKSKEQELVQKQEEAKKSEESSAMNNQASQDGTAADEGTNNAEKNDKLVSSTNNSKLYPAPKTVIDLVKFGNGLKTLSDNYPYIFQTVDGLDTAYANYFKTDNNNLKSSGDEKISITCLESVDMRISTLFNRYLNSAYDRTWKRDRLPINLRKFNTRIYVHDSRSFLNIYTRLGNSLLEVLNNVTQLSIDEQLALSHLSTVVFSFYECEIVPEETGNIFDSVSNVDGDMKQTKFTFKYNDVKVDFVNFVDVLSEQDAINTFSDNYNNTQNVSERNLYNSVSRDSNNKNDMGELSVSGNIYGRSPSNRTIASDLIDQGRGLLKMGITNLLNENVYDENILADAKRTLTLLNTTNPASSIAQGLIGRGIQALANDKQKTLGDMTKDLITGGIKPNDTLQNLKDFGGKYFDVLDLNNDTDPTNDLGNVY